VTIAARRLEAAALARAVSATTFDQARPLVTSGPRRRAASLVADLMAAMAVVLGIPVVILAIGTPIALGVRLLLWAAGLL
jgi:hypothetical protein